MPSALAARAGSCSGPACHAAGEGGPATSRLPAQRSEVDMKSDSVRFGKDQRSSGYEPGELPSVCDRLSPMIWLNPRAVDRAFSNRPRLKSPRFWIEGARDGYRLRGTSKSTTAIASTVSGSGGWTRTSDLRVMSPNLGEGASNRISTRLRVPSVAQYPRAQRG